MTKVVNRKVDSFRRSDFGARQLRCRPLQKVFDSLPQAVLGGCTIMMFGNIILSGFQMISEAGYTQRNITIAALSLTIGIGFTQVGERLRQLPGAVPVHLRFQLHRGVVRGGCDSQRRLCLSEERLLSATSGVRRGLISRISASSAI